jgi:hypothetical protein
MSQSRASMDTSGSSSATTMNKTLHLTKGERALFDKLPDNLREGWEVQDETRVFKDTPEKRRMRLELMRVSSPQLRDFQKKAPEMKTVDELLAAMDGVNLSALDDDDILQLYFAMGPGAVGALIVAHLSEAADDSAVEGVSALSLIRFGLLNSLL